jgi:RNA polymerase sigma-70 factor (ECF subfamily)
VSDVRDRTNAEWLQELRRTPQDDALSDLRVLLVRGLQCALSDRPRLTDADVEDFAQEALLRILAKLDTFEGRSRFTTWAHKIAVRIALSELRRRRWRDVSIEDLVTQYDDGDFTPAVLADGGDSPHQIAAQRMLFDTVLRLIDEELTERQRQALVAVVLAGMPLQEVADRMGTNRNALYKLLHDARQHLKRQMLSRGLTPESVLEAFGE